VFRIYSSALNLNEDQEPSVGGLEDILDEIVLQGMHSWLNKFPKPLLEAWCSDLSIQYTQRSDLVDRIMTKIFSLQQLEDDVNLSITPMTSSQNEDKKEKKTTSKNKHEDSSQGEKRSSSKKKQPKRKFDEGSNESKKEKSKKRRSKESSDESESDEKRDRHSRKRKEEDSESRKSKSPRKKSLSINQIKRGMSSSELNRFQRKELVPFCKEQNIPYTGTKEQIVKRIILHLKEKLSDSEEENKSKEKEKSHTKKK